MALIVKPMLAASLKSFDELDFENNEYLATPKIDGIRALMIDGHLVSRTFKPIRNKYIRTVLESLLPNGADGEIVCPGGFQKTSSSVMSEDGEPEFSYIWFDYVIDVLCTPYFKRVNDLYSYCVNVNVTCLPNGKKIVPLIPKHVRDVDNLKEFEQSCINYGYEGVIVRTANSPYKCGRSTMKEQYLVKIKRFEDSEAVITGFIEEMRNDNEATKDAFGGTKRSSHQDNKTPLNTLGALMVKDLITGIEFEVGTGFDDQLRKLIWMNKKDWLGLVISTNTLRLVVLKISPDILCIWA